MWLALNWESNQDVTPKGTTSNYFQSFRTSSYGFNGANAVESIDGKRYVYMVVDNFSRFTWVDFIKEKSNTFEVFKDLCQYLQRKKESVIVRNRSDHGKEFENTKFSEFFSTKGISHEFSSPITP